MKPHTGNDSGPGNTYTMQWAGGPTPLFDPAALMAQQQRAGEAMAAAGRAFLEGMQQVTKRSFVVQSALFRQFFVGALALSRAGSGVQADQAVRGLGAASDATAKAIRDIIDAACKCSLDIVAAYRGRIVGAETAGAKSGSKAGNC